ncbi:hypothetical protein CUJ84_Chr002206 [Rhizobium leguminosarum]|uniref:Uncharacterized protein n=1 Tax=Rhizobium leguminosarum TaxID=384 RepID=A0A2K9Z306_RHILE|nr:hypothetical protein CUJ84_Chr002206 [Rhizobium leguminosarum]
MSARQHFFRSFQILSSHLSRFEDHDSLDMHHQHIAALVAVRAFYFWQRLDFPLKERWRIACTIPI